MAEIDTIINYFPHSNWLGTAGQPLREEFAAIKAAGYEVVLNLVPHDNPDAVTEEAQLVRLLGMEYIHLPVSWLSPTLADLDAFFTILNSLRGRKTFIHCVLNMRVSAFLFLYQHLVEGLPQEQARELMDMIWDSRDYPAWDTLIQDALARGPAKIADML